MINLYLKYSAFTAVKKMQNSKLHEVCETDVICQWKVYVRGSIFVKNGI